MVHYIRKASGEVEPFNINKFEQSLKKAGASDAVIQKLVTDIKHAPGITSTKDIYEYAWNYLKTVARPSASRYSLKNALYDLGPEGFAFEKFVAELFKAQHFSVSLDQTLKGQCVTHEVDLVLVKNNEHITVECKFHNTPGIKSDVKVPLYIKARFDDISAAWEENSKEATYIHKQLLITNTKFTSDAIAYGECMHITMIGWAYPEKGNIADLIVELNVHPITSLTSLSSKQKHVLVNQNILLCMELVENPNLLNQLSLTEGHKQDVLDECKVLTQSKQGE